jgi:hypothetical protein
MSAAVSKIEVSTARIEGSSRDSSHMDVQVASDRVVSAVALRWAFELIDTFCGRSPRFIKKLKTPTRLLTGNCSAIFWSPHPTPKHQHVVCCPLVFFVASVISGQCVTVLCAPKDHKPSLSGQFVKHPPPSIKGRDRQLVDA